MILLGLWDVDQVDDVNHGVRVYDVHSAPVNCLTFDKFNSARLLSTSYDGFVRCLDFHTGVFEEVDLLSTLEQFHFTIKPNTVQLFRFTHLLPLASFGLHITLRETHQR